MTREDLKKYAYAQEWITEQLERYQKQRAMVENIISNLDGMPKAKNKTNYNLEKLMDSYNKLIEIIIAEQEKQNEIMLQLKEVEEPYRTILTNKYIDGKALDEIAYKIGYAYDNVCRMHGIGLNLFDEIESRQ